MALGVLCITLDPEMEKMAMELRDISDVGDEAQSDHLSRETNPRLRKTQLNRFLFDVLHTAIVERYQQVKSTRVAIPDKKSAAAGDRDQADGFF